MTLNTVQDGVVVALEYTLSVDDQVIEETNGSPIEYLHGFNNIISGLESKLFGMKLGEEKEIVVQPDEAYGKYYPEGVFELQKSQFPQSFPFEIGYSFRVRTEQGQLLNARITGLKEDVVVIDTNHPLAGKVLQFFVRIVGLRQPTEEELLRGRVGGGCTTCGSSNGCTSCG